MTDLQCKEFVYVAFLLFCKKHGIRPVPEESFYMRLLKEVPCRLVKQGNDEVFTGFLFKPEIEEALYREVINLSDLPKEMHPLPEHDFYYFVKLLKHNLIKELGVKP